VESPEATTRQQNCILAAAMKFTRIIPAEEKLAGFKELESLNQTWISGYLQAAGRKIPVLKTRLSLADHLGTLKVRLNIGRNHYSVLPGLYATGVPDSTAPVLVTANYKLSLDSLRKELAGIDTWVLVLDTRGINVWCAAGKGNFGTKEVAGKIRATKLADLVAKRKLVLPQLGAVGVSAPELARLTGFRAIWGPVRAADLPAFLASGMKKDDSMRQVYFGLVDRLKLVPTEMVQAWPFAASALGLAAVLALPAGPNWHNRFIESSGALLGIWLTGTVAFPLLLPILPGLAFSVKGAILGAIWGVTAALLAGASFPLGLALSLVSGSVVSYLAMNFTGASTFTSQSGALLEVDKAIIPQAAALASGLVLGLVAIITGRGGLA
jgi:hypothetical protein